MAAVPLPIPINPHIPGIHINDQKVLLIQNKLRRLLERHVLAYRESSITLPSAVELSGIFGCSELEVLTALNYLQQEGFQYRMLGLDVPILLQDTLRASCETPES